MLPNDIVITILGFVLGQQKDWFTLIPYQDVCVQWEFIIKYLFQKNFGKQVKLPKSLIEFHINDPEYHTMLSGYYVDGDININQLPKMMKIIYPHRLKQLSEISYYNPFPDYYKIIIWASDFYMNSSLKKISQNNKLSIEIRCDNSETVYNRPIFFSSKLKISYFDENPFGYFLQKNQSS
jgi:hypothetical protein